MCAANAMEVITGWTVLVPETYEIALDTIKKYHNLLQTTYDEEKIHRFVLMCVVCSWHKPLNAPILSWAMDHGHVIVSSLEGALADGQALPPPAANQEARRG